jgi:hypothetical protein
MPTFKTNKTMAPVIPDGCYLAKVISAKEKLSANGNEMIVMQLQLAGAGIIPCILTFVDRAKAAINAFCASAELIRPKVNNVEVNLTANDCLGRYLYVTIFNEHDGEGGDPYPKIVRFLTRQAALIKNPQLSKIKLREPQLPRQLKVITPQAINR